MNFMVQGGLIGIFTLGLSALLTFALTKLLSRSRKKGLWTIPGFGGIAVFISFWTSFFVLFPSLLIGSSQTYLFLASFVVLVTGILDDKFELRPWQKSLGILIAAHIVFFLARVEFSTVFLPKVSPWLFFILSYLLTILWIYFVTNAVNLMDGIDGLAGTVTMVSLLSMALTTFIFALSIRMAIFMMLILLALAILGFLPFNWAPAKIYLGDTGALFIGFMYASLTVSNLKNASFFTMILPVFVCAVPLFDTSYAIFRRLFTGQSIVAKDQEHIHHRLTRWGLSSPQIVGMMVGVTIIFAVLATVAQQYPAYRLWVMGITVLVVGLLTYFMYNIGRNRPKNPPTSSSVPEEDQEAGD